MDNGQVGEAAVLLVASPATGDALSAARPTFLPCPPSRFDLSCLSISCGRGLCESAAGICYSPAKQRADFPCERRLLLREMKYFQSYLVGVSCRLPHHTHNMV